MKNTFSSVKNKIVSRYSLTDNNENLKKSTDINILLNRVKLDKKKTAKKRIIFFLFLSCLVTSLIILFV